MSVIHFKTVSFIPFFFAVLLLTANLTWASVIIETAHISKPELNTQLKQGRVITHARAKLFSKQTLDSEKKAYQIQKTSKGQGVINSNAVLAYKAGLMNEAVYKKFGLSSAVSGVFLHDALLKNNSKQGPLISLRSAYQLMVEQEFAFKLSQDISQTVTADNMTDFIAAVAPAIELPDISFAAKKFDGLDVIANNVLAYKFFIGAWQPLTENLMSQLDSSSLKLFCGDELIAQGSGDKALGSQTKALVWMINHLLAQGFELRQGQILLTGNLIPMTAAKPCEYRAEFSPLFDELSFIIAP